MSGFELGLVLAAFAGGAFGAAIGALPSFAFTGFLVIAGEILDILGGAGASGGANITGAVAFGPGFGPHVAFGGGAAAAAYLAREESFAPDFDYHQAKEITVGLGTRPDVLFVGGTFGVIGHLLLATSNTLGIPWDPVAFGVVASALLHRLAFGYSIIGARPRRWLDMTPYERGERRESLADGQVTDGQVTDGGTAQSGRLAVEPWLPHQYRWANVAVLGVVCGMLGAYIAYRTGSAFLAFGVSAASLLFIVAGVDRIPVTHHMTLPGSTVVLAAVPGAASGVTPAEIGAVLSMPEALALGAVLGLFGALAGELLQRVLYAHAATHLDPPAASIVFSSLLLGVLAILDVLPSPVWIPV
jgi:hypothetical protein